MDKLVNKLCYTLAGIKAAAGNNSKLSDISLKDQSLHGKSVLYYNIELLKVCTRVELVYVCRSQLPLIVTSISLDIARP